MPTYEYACRKCGHEFEKFQNISDEPVKRCPKCKGKVVKQFSAGAGLLFKGAGFYQTDYRSESYKKGAKSESQTSSGKKDSGSPDSKASKPAETKKK